MPHTRLVELSPDAMFVNCQGRFVFANQATAKLLGFEKPADLIGLPVLQFIRPDFHEAVKERIAATQGSGEPVPYMDQVYVRRDGTEVPVSVSAVAFTWEGCPAIEVCVRDVTQQKRLENEAIAGRTAADQASLSKSRLVTAVSHDLRQPLQSLSLFASVIDADPNLSAQSKIALAHLRRSVERMGELLNATLDLAKLDAGLVTFQAQAIDLDPLIEDLVTEVMPQAEAKALKVRGVKNSVRVVSDPVLLMTIMRNLVVNAIRYTETGKVLIGVRHKGERVMVGVYDTGIGIDPSKLRLVFEEFYQVDNPARDSASGLGLGLSIVERLSRLLGHQIVVRSTKGRGSLFGVMVPKAP